MQEPGGSAKRGKGLDVAGEEARQPRIVEEAHEEVPRVRQHYDEGEEPPHPAGDLRFERG